MTAAGRPAEVKLVPAEDADYAWMLDAGPAPGDLRLPEGGIDEPPVIEQVRRIADRQRLQGYRGSWLMAVNDEVVGLCGYHAAPLDGSVEIGYNVAPARRNLGYATRAIAALIREAQADSAILTVVAETALSNLPSQKVLERNGFERAGEYAIPEGERFIRWTRNVRCKTV
jgi:RimJ/RimL family protein N-acetyltransferase